ncbi:hypothetical protein GS636_06685 [Ruegeria sp. HKCCD4884]|uniref:hypothetical protein n=1 Tax=Ruegeria sp. HKCCD4884 TaxID=2683022 RepID=UPI00149167EB|nr:hypothetical protein [Ruegeria sp. HKCCD4884]NOD92467.1 hypothetical protein [Ruegeria sp. HKCCD4884]
MRRTPIDPATTKPVGARRSQSQEAAHRAKVHLARAIEQLEQAEAKLGPYAGRSFMRQAVETLREGRNTCRDAMQRVEDYSLGRRK